MENKLDTAKLMRAAKKLGLQVEVNPNHAGFSLNKDGKIYSWEELAESITKRFKVDKKK